MDAINLDEFLRANESEIRWKVESLVLERVTRAIGRENLGKVTLTFQGSAFDDMAVRAVRIEGPDDLKAWWKGREEHYSGRVNGPRFCEILGGRGSVRACGAAWLAGRLALPRSCKGI